MEKKQVHFLGGLPGFWINILIICYSVKPSIFGLISVVNKSLKVNW